jgi:chromosome segregation ATPase
MNCANKALLLLLVVVTLGLWGCAQGSGPAPGSARMRDLESRHAKLEEDYRGAVAARDQARKELEALEQERTALQQQLEQANKDREDLRQQVAARAGERDNLQASLIQLGKDLHSLAGRIDAAAGVHVSPPVTTATPAATNVTPEKS